MKRKTFNQGMATLLNAKPYAQDRITPETEEVYWHVLQHIPDAKFNEGVTKCLVECHFFPGIPDLVARIYPPYEKLPPYNPHGNGKLITVTSEQQLARVNREVQAIQEKKRDRIEQR